MAATLPTFTVSDATGQRILAAFSNQVDMDTGAAMTPTNAYKRWLKEVLVQRVTQYEATASTSTLSNELT